MSSKKESELHWKYNEGVLLHSLPVTMTKEEIIKLCGYLYMKAMVHGYGHGVKLEWHDT